jgi:hypothetical protein
MHPSELQAGGHRRKSLHAPLDSLTEAGVALRRTDPDTTRFTRRAEGTPLHRKAESLARSVRYQSIGGWLPGATAEGAAKGIQDMATMREGPVKGSVAGAPTGIISLVAAAILLGAPLQGCGEAPDPEPIVEEAPDPEPVVEEAPDPEPMVVGNMAGAVDSIWLVPKVYHLVDPPPLFPVAWMDSRPWICTEDFGWPYPPTGDRRGWTELHLSSSGGVRADLVARDGRFIPDPECRTVWVHK